MKTHVTQEMIAEYINMRLENHGLDDLRGRKTHVWLNGAQDHESVNITEARNTAQPNDTLFVKVTKRNGESLLSGHIFIPEEDNADIWTIVLNRMKEAAELRKHKTKRQTRDYQKSRAYGAEWSTIKIVDEIGAEIPNLTQSQAEYLCGLVTDFFGHGRVNGVTVSKKLKSRSFYRPADQTISLASGWGQQANVVLHEVAHHLDRDSRRAHGIEFNGWLIVVHSLFLSPFLEGKTPHDVMLSITNQMRKHGVRYNHLAVLELQKYLKHYAQVKADVLDYVNH